MNKKNSERSNRTQIIAIAFLLVLVVVGSVWAIQLYLRPPAVEVANLKYVQLMRTVISTQDQTALNKLKSKLEKLHQSNELTDAEHVGFHRIISMAESGQWDDADKACERLEKAQQNRSRKVTE